MDKCFPAFFVHRSQYVDEGILKVFKMVSLSEQKHEIIFFTF